MTTKKKVTERHGTASVAVEDKLAVLPPKTREEHRPWHQDTRRETMAEHNAVVGIYTTHTEAEAAVKALQQAGFNMQKLSIVGKDYHTEEHVIGYYTTGDRMQVWGKRGAFWGGLWGLLWSGFFIIPGIGPLLVFGPLVSWIIGALEGAVMIGGLSALGAALYSLGIPKDSIVEYETALKSDQFLVMAYGTGEEAAQAQRLLEAAGAAQVAAYQATIPRETLAHEAFMHGNTCLAAGQFAEAIAAFHQALELNPKHPYVAERLAEVERRQQAAGATPPGDTSV
jgi:tetratricopeptide (TPR) repeat protein